MDVTRRHNENAKYNTIYQINIRILFCNSKSQHKKYGINVLLNYIIDACAKHMSHDIPSTVIKHEYNSTRASVNHQQQYCYMTRVI